jgi:ADP-ribose pyrophosphatase YjhB (NUDIX family)
MEIRSCVLGLIIKNNKVLLIQESKSECRGQWFFPAGRIENNENILDALKREVKEEANVEISIEGLFYFDECDQSNKYGNYRRYRFVFICNSDSIIEKDVEDEHSIQSKWIDIDEIDKYDFRSKIVPELLNKYKESKNIIKTDNIRVVYS